jgi:hypothetical protein
LVGSVNDELQNGMDWTFTVRPATPARVLNRGVPMPSPRAPGCVPAAARRVGVAVGAAGGVGARSQPKSRADATAQSGKRRMTVLRERRG